MAKNENHQVTETVAVLDGDKVLVIRVDGQVRAVQNKQIVDERIVNVEKVIKMLDQGLAMSDAEHLATAESRIDERIEAMKSRKATLTAEGVAAAAKARLTEKRVALAAQRIALVAVSAELANEDPQAPAPTETPSE